VNTSVYPSFVWITHQEKLEGCQGMIRLSHPGHPNSNSKLMELPQDTKGAIVVVNLEDFHNTCVQFYLKGRNCILCTPHPFLSVSYWCQFLLISRALKYFVYRKTGVYKCRLISFLNHTYFVQQMIMSSMLTGKIIIYYRPHPTSLKKHLHIYPPLSLMLTT
jgi:hypothetical protein